jgi:glycosyltransferase involved in cell wall biosynthesis
LSRAEAVSVIIPVYNGERFLASALASVRAQTHPAAEVIVVDDGSTDRSARIAAELLAGWPALRMLSQPNAGPSAARNAGLARASGDFVTFLDADDQMTPERTAIQLAFLADHPEADLVLGSEWIELEEGVTPPDWLRALPSGVPNPLIFSMLVRRAAFDRVGGFDPSLRLAEETDWLYRARAAGIGIATIEDVLLRRRLHGGNLTHDVSLADMRRTHLAVVRARVESRRAEDG